MTDSDPDVRWMSYADAAKALGVNPESVARRMRRDGWARRHGNDGKPRVAVPVNLLPVLAGVPVNVPDGPGNAASSAASVPDMIPAESPDKAAMLELIERAASAEGEAATLRQWVEMAGGRLQAADRRLADERIQAEARLEELRTEAARLRAEGEAARIQAAEAKATAEGLRLALEEARRPFWRRWIG
jgi:hypothetical protein